MRTVASVVSGAHATAMAVTVANVASAHRVKKAPQITLTTLSLLIVTALDMTKRKPHKRPVSHVNHVSNANLVVSAKNVHHVTRCVMKSRKLHLQSLLAQACRLYKRSHCL
jgi:hypothetical protein